MTRTSHSDLEESTNLSFVPLICRLKTVTHSLTLKMFLLFQRGLKKMQRDQKN